MQLQSQITIHRPNGDALVQLLHGDLSAIPEEHETDILVISAFPGDYTPLEGSLMGALFDKGLNVAELALSKAVDLRAQLHCWLSHVLSKKMQDKLNVKRLLCFEPGNRLADPEQVVGNIFRCINAFAFEDQNNVIALPVVAAGSQRVPLETIFPILVNAAIFWLENGLPLQQIKLVIYREEQVPTALRIFEHAKQLFELKNPNTIGDLSKETEETSIENRPGRGNDRIISPAALPGEMERLDGDSFTPGINREGNTDEAPFQDVPQAPPMPPQPAPIPVAETTAPPSTGTDYYDYFISYAHTHSNLINSFIDLVKARNAQLNIFYDRDSIPAGSQWIRQLSAAIQKAKKVLIFLSPDYDKSPVCWDEFQCAKLMEYNRRQEIIQTIYLYDYKDIEMPPIMGIYSYIDCREGDQEKLKECIQKIFK